MTYKSVSKSFNLSMLKCAYLSRPTPTTWTRFGGPDNTGKPYVRSNVPGVETVKPEGTHLAWLDTGVAIAAAGTQQAADESEEDTTPEQEFQRYLVERADIHLNPGPSSGLSSDGRMRMNIAPSRQLVERALGNMARALADA